MRENESKCGAICLSGGACRSGTGAITVVYANKLYSLDLQIAPLFLCACMTLWLSSSGADVSDLLHTMRVHLQRFSTCAEPVLTGMQQCMQYRSYRDVVQGLRERGTVFVLVSAHIASVEDLVRSTSLFDSDTATCTLVLCAAQHRRCSCLLRHARGVVLTAYNRSPRTSRRDTVTTSARKRYGTCVNALYSCLSSQTESLGQKRTGKQQAAVLPLYNTKRS